MIIKYLSTGEKTRKELEKLIGLGQTRVTNLLRELQDLELVEKIKVGRKVIYKIKQ